MTELDRKWRPQTLNARSTNMLIMNILFLISRNSMRISVKRVTRSQICTPLPVPAWWWRRIENEAVLTKSSLELSSFKKHQGSERLEDDDDDRGAKAIA